MTKRLLRFFLPRDKLYLGSSWQKKASELLFALLIICLPIQLGKHFWPSFAYLWSLPIDYFSPTFYLTDGLILGIILLFIFDKIKEKRISEIIGLFSFQLILKCILGLLFTALNLSQAANRGLAFYKVVKFVEFCFLGIYVYSSSKSNGFEKFQKLFIFPAVYSCLIACGQFYKQASLGSFFWWLGERSFDLQTPGIAKTTVGGQMILRSYATFPHPHALASFLLISLLLTWPILARRKRIAFLSLTSLGILFTFSRYIWLLSFLFGFGWLIKKFWWRKTRFTILLVSLVLVTFLGWQFRSLFVSDRFSFQRRWQLNTVAVAMVKDNLISGVGAGNFISRLPDYWSSEEGIRFLQPVHNVYLLLMAQLGIVVSLFLIAWFFKIVVLVFSKRNFYLGLSLLVVCLTGLFDHHWLTLQQNQILLTLILAWSARVVASD